MRRRKRISTPFRCFTVFEKYDEYVPAELVRKGFACGVLDLAGLRERIKTWYRFGGE